MNESVLVTSGASPFTQRRLAPVQRLLGNIDRRQHGYDLRDYAAKNWSRVGPLVAGKIHFMCGDMDNFYLNLAVYLFEESSNAAANPASGFTFEYGRPLKGHWWHPGTGLMSCVQWPHK